MSRSFATSLVLATAAFLSASVGVVTTAEAEAGDASAATRFPLQDVLQLQDALEVNESIVAALVVSLPAPAVDPVAANTLGRIALECPPNPVASAVDGGSLDATQVGSANAHEPAQANPSGPLGPAGPSGPSGPSGLAGSWCRDANDPQCAPLSPTPNAPSWGPGESLPRWLNTSFQLAPPALGRDDRAGSLLAPTADFRLPRGQGPSGYARSLERPPRAI